MVVKAVFPNGESGGLPSDAYRARQKSSILPSSWLRDRLMFLRRPWNRRCGGMVRRLPNPVKYGFTSGAT